MSKQVKRGSGLGERLHGTLTNVPTIVLWGVIIIWTIPTLGVLISSIRPLADTSTSGWWTWFGHPTLTLENYNEVLFRETLTRRSMITHGINSLAISVPATIVPIAFASYGAYAFAWMKFKGRNWLFVAIVSLSAMPLQMALIPLLQLWNGGATLTVIGQDFRVFPELGIAGTATSVWLTHSAFGLPLAVFLIHNYIASLPRDIIESATIDGASHGQIYRFLVLPLSIPAIAAYAIFQFLWTWNDFLTASVLLTNKGQPMTVALVNLVGEQGQDFQLRFAAAFVTILIPLVVFFSLQRHFVRGLLAGSVKG